MILTTLGNNLLDNHQVYTTPPSTYVPHYPSQSPLELEIHVSCLQDQCHHDDDMVMIIDEDV